MEKLDPATKSSIRIPRKPPELLVKLFGEKIGEQFGELFPIRINATGANFGLFGINDGGIGVPDPDTIIPEPTADPPPEEPPIPES